MWRPESKGYTTSLARAGTYSKEEATEICDLTDYNFMLPLDIAKAKATMCLDSSFFHETEMRNSSLEQQAKGVDK